jgi:hypothetical protein
MNELLVISTAVSALATCVIAVYSCFSWKLTVEMKRANDLKDKADQEFKEQVSDLYRAIVVATILSGPSSYGSLDQATSAFNAQYAGKTKIFK